MIYVYVPYILPSVTQDKMGAGGIIGIIIAVLLVMAGVGFVGYNYMRYRPKTSSPSGGFDNALYSESKYWRKYSMSKQVESIVYQSDSISAGG